MQWAANNFVPLLFAGLLGFLLSGFPVAFALAAAGLSFGLLGIALDLFPPVLFQALPLRVFGIMQNDTLLAVPFFTFMGIVLERSGIAEDLLETAGQVFGPLRGGVALSVIAVGALLAATTGVVSAAVMSMGLISLPVMLRYQYNRGIATGVIMASGVLAQAIPPSVVLIVLADQLGRSVGDMYAGAMVPGLLLVCVYAIFIVGLAFVRPAWVPALPPEARNFREANGSTGHRSLLVLSLISAVAALGWSRVHESVLGGNGGQGEVLVLSISAGAATALLLASIDRFLPRPVLSRLAVRVTLMLIPPLILIFLVLGTIFLGVATPTEGGAMGAVGALVLAVVRRRLDFPLLRQAVDYTAQLTCFVVFILIGATVFSFAFNAADGHIWVEHLFNRLPGGETGFLVAVMALVFVLGCFLDFFEIAFIVIPILAPVADKMGIDLIWFGVLIAMNLQTSYLTPPFGFALFFLRSVAPQSDYIDRVTQRAIRKVTTPQIYSGSIAFVLLQLLMVGVLLARPDLVTGQLDSGPKIDARSVEIEVERGGYGTRDDDPMKRFGR
ncbi:MAG: TRAP transporter large permease subunit [Burkholderiaceae bacterium]|nr:TRAP transporter large permease subunit [Burkholderiaceae bacterium]